MSVTALGGSPTPYEATQKINETIDQVNANTTNLSAHTSASNPHNITAATVNAISLADKGISGGVATLGYYRRVEANQSSAYIYQISSDRTLTTLEAGVLYKCTNISPITITIPTNSSATFETSIEIEVVRYGTGAVTISPASGVTLNSKDNARSIASQYGAASLKKMGTNEWWMVGDLE